MQGTLYYLIGSIPIQIVPRQVYQNQKGFQFRSIDKMITNEPKATYTYTEVNKSSIERDNDFTILKYSTNRNQNLLEKLRNNGFKVFIDTLLSREIKHLGISAFGIEN